MSYRSRCSWNHANGTDDLDLVVELNNETRAALKEEKKWNERKEKSEIQWVHCFAMCYATNLSRKQIVQIPSSTNTISTIALSGISILCVHIQLVPQSAGRLSPLQNCSGFISSYCDSSGAGGDKYEISSINDMTWSPVGATAVFVFDERKNWVKYSLMYRTHYISFEIVDFDE